MYTQEQLDAINAAARPINTRPTISAGEVREEMQRNPGFVSETVRGVAAGVERGFKNTLGLVDTLAFDVLPDSWSKPVIDSPTSTFGGIVQGISQFAVGFGFGSLAVNATMRAAGGVKALSWATAVPAKVTALAAAGKTTQALLLNAATQGVAAGALADFIAFKEDEERLSNIANATGYGNVITEFLAADGDDGVLLGRLKNTLEGALVGIPFQLGIDSLLRAAGRGRFAKKAIEAGATPEEAISQAVAKYPEPEVKLPVTIEDAGDRLVLKTNTGFWKEQSEAISRREAEGKAFANDAAKKAYDASEARFVEALSKPEPVWPMEDAFADIRPQVERRRAYIKLDQQYKSGSITFDQYMDGREYLEKTPVPKPVKALPAEVVDEVETTGGTVSRKKIEKDRAAIAKEITSRDDIMDPEFGRKAGTEDALGAFKSSLEDPRDLNVNPRKLGADELGSLGIARTFMNRSKDIFKDGPDSAAKLFRTAVDLGIAKTGAANPGMDAVRARHVEFVAKLTGADAQTIQRQISKLRLGSDQIHTIAETARVSRDIAEMLAVDLQGLLKGWDLDTVSSEMASRELLSRVRGVTSLTEAVTDTWSSLGFELRNIKEAVSVPKPKKGPLTWTVLDELETLSSAGDTPATRQKFKVIAKQIQEITRNAEPGEALIMAKNFAESPWDKKLGSMTMEYFMNSILSTPASWVVNGVSALTIGIYRPVERMVGAKFASKFGRIADDQVKAIIARESKVVQGFLRNAGEAWKISKAGGSVGYRKVTKFDGLNNFSPLKQGLTNKFGDPGRILGNVLTFPSAVMNKTDDFFKVLNYRARASAELSELAVKEGIPADMVSDWTEATIKMMTENRAALRQRAAIERVLPDAIASGADDIEGEVLKRMDTEHSSIQKLLDIHDRSIRQGELGTFTQDLTKEAGTISSLGIHAQKLVQAHPTMKIFLPFIRTPTNLSQFAWDRSFGVAFETFNKGSEAITTRLGLSPRSLDNIGKITAELTSIDPVVRADAMGRVAASLTFVGTSVAALTAQYQSGDLPFLTGTGPQDKEERRALEQAGWQPYSVKIGARYVSYQRFDPFATLLGIMADYVDTSSRMATDPTNSGLEDMVVPWIAALSKNITSKTYMEGLSNLLELANGDTRAVSKAMGSIAGGFVPGVLSGPVGDTDPYMREIRGVLDRIMTRVPGMSSHLAPRRNILGEKVKRNSTTGVATVDMFLPTRMMTVSDDVIEKEIAQLKYGFNIPPLVYRGVDLTDTAYIQGDQDAYDRLLELKGSVKVGGLTLRQSLRKLIQSREFQALPIDPDELGNQSPRVYLMNGILNKYQKVAWDKILKENRELASAYNTVVSARQASRRPSLLN